MVALVLKKKPAFEPVQAVKSPLELQLDLVGSQMAEAIKINKQIKDLQAKLKPYKDEADKLQKMVDELEMGDDATDIIKGDRFRAEIGAKGQSRSITDLPKVRKFLGDKLFMELATVTLKNIDDYLTPPQREEVLKVERTKRSLKIEKV
ncbi:hypothetical protein [Hyphomicrobium sp. ghe19]|uniref:hypothetical protein n=1 Tax=Hyphomicrobium sp. ghe19 TaxID=2682968 RepID=UPI001366FC62|nr:hypothetical protein HYPP_02470 [Hyphomicrobium sp. ghe19]